MKTSPLCSCDDGREIFFTAKIDDNKFRFTIPRDLLDDTCGNSANEKARKTWVTENKEQILDSRHAATVAAPLNRVRIEEIT